MFKKVNKIIFSVLIMVLALTFQTSKVKAYDVEDSVGESLANLERFEVPNDLVNDVYYAQRDNNLIQLTMETPKWGGFTRLWIKTEYKMRGKILACKEVADGVCTKWEGKEIKIVASQVESTRKVSYTLDSLKEIPNALNSYIFTEGGISYNDLTDSNYDMSDLYFVAIEYKKDRLFSDDYTYNVIKIVKHKDVAVSCTGTECEITSNVPLKELAYIKRDDSIKFEELSKTKNVDNIGKFLVKNGNAEIEPTYSAGEFKYTVDEGDGYLRVVSKNGDMITKDIQNSNTEVGLMPSSPFTSSSVGKIILISLLAILVLSLVLVIFQKASDRKKKIY